MKQLKIAVVMFLGAFALSGCETLGLGGSGSATEGTGSSSTSTYGDNPGASTTGIDGGEAYSGDPLFNPASPLSKRVIHFAFDSSEVADAYLPIIAAHAAYLADNPSKNVTLEAYADERGSREYNVALSEQRGNTVADLMKLQDVSPSQIQVIGYGEEKPVSFEHDELSWEKNRRVEITYSGE
jgi:peptidoglycan-associated lipoprotein